MKSDDELVEAVLKGDHRSFEVLLRPYSQGLLNMAYRMTGNLEDAKEICQEALIKIYKYLGRFTKGRSFKSWIYKITVNSIHDFLRRKKRNEDVVDNQKSSLANVTLNPEEQLVNKEIKGNIEICLQALSPKEKIVFILRDAGGFSIKETSVISGCSSFSVRTHLSRARQKIRQKFKDIYEDYRDKGVSQ